MTIDSADDSKISNRTINTNRTYDSKLNRITKLRRSLVVGSCYWMTPDKFYLDQPPLPWQRNLRQNRLWLGLYTISGRSLRPTRGFRGRATEWCHTNSTTTDPGCRGMMAATFEPKWAITQLVWEISLRYLRLVVGFRVLKTKSPITRLV